jgi:hypothetical protein
MINFHGNEKIAEGELTLKPAIYINLYYFKEWDFPKGQKITEVEIEELKRFADENNNKIGEKTYLYFE